MTMAGTTTGTLCFPIGAEYDLSVERRRADERAKDTQWTRRFPHERGNWPTFVFVAGESSRVPLDVNLVSCYCWATGTG